MATLKQRIENDVYLLINKAVVYAVMTHPEKFV